MIDSSGLSYLEVGRHSRFLHYNFTQSFIKKTDYCRCRILFNSVNSTSREEFQSIEFDLYQQGCDVYMAFETSTLFD